MNELLAWVHQNPSSRSFEMFTTDRAVRVIMREQSGTDFAGMRGWGFEVSYEELYRSNSEALREFVERGIEEMAELVARGKG